MEKEEVEKEEAEEEEAEKEDVEDAETIALIPNWGTASKDEIREGRQDDVGAISVEVVVDKLASRAFDDVSRVNELASGENGTFNEEGGCNVD